MKRMLLWLGVALTPVAGAEAQPLTDRPSMVRVSGSESIPTFEISAHEITFSQWEACVRGGGCANNRSPDDAGWGRGARPVVNVSWLDAQEYVDWLSQANGSVYRLPTAAEWEHASGAIPEALIDHAWIRENSGLTTHVPGERLANANGLFDMYGNVEEWVADCTNPTCVAHVLKGGAWDYPERIMRSQAQIGGQSTLRRSSIGFRVARSLN